MDDLKEFLKAHGKVLWWLIVSISPWAFAAGFLLSQVVTQEWWKLGLGVLGIVIIARQVALAVKGNQYLDD